MRKILIFIFLSIFSSQVFAGERVNLPDINVLGKSINEKFSLFPNKVKDANDPIQVSYRVYKGKINVIEMYYAPEINYESIRKEINRKYKQYQQPDQGPKNRPLAIWHLPNKVEIQMQSYLGKFVEVVVLTGESFEWQ